MPSSSRVSLLATVKQEEDAGLLQSEHVRNKSLSAGSEGTERPASQSGDTVPSDSTVGSAKASSSPEPMFDDKPILSPAPSEVDEKPLDPARSGHSPAPSPPPAMADRKSAASKLTPVQVMNPWDLDITLSTARLTFLRVGGRAAGLRKRYGSFDFTRQRIKGTGELPKNSKHNDIKGAGCTQNLTPVAIFPDNGINRLPRRLGEPFTLFCTTLNHLDRVHDYSSRRKNAGQLSCFIKRKVNEWMYWGEMVEYRRGVLTGEDWRQLGRDSPQDQAALKEQLRLKITMNKGWAGKKRATVALADEIAADLEAELRVKKDDLAAERGKARVKALKKEIAKAEKKLEDAWIAPTRDHPLRSWGLVGQRIEDIVRELEDTSNVGTAICYGVFQCVALNEVKMNAWCKKREKRRQEERLYRAKGAGPASHHTDDEDDAEDSGDEDSVDSSLGAARAARALFAPDAVNDFDSDLTDLSESDAEDDSTTSTLPSFEDEKPVLPLREKNGSGAQIASHKRKALTSAKEPKVRRTNVSQKKKIKRE